ncbi:hypothetical protein AB0M46_32850, partial [Dactylosporangium sp. NPDC051485]|uniref:hypothetical protein n=1 Tax=Dactylosporangium sp. NPDC051485 TaxID=3154846 RepID=UPI003436D0EF
MGVGEPAQRRGRLGGAQAGEGRSGGDGELAGGVQPGEPEQPLGGLVELPVRQLERRVRRAPVDGEVDGGGCRRPVSADCVYCGIGTSYLPVSVARVSFA